MIDLFLAIALGFQWFIVGRVFRRVHMLERAIQHLAPEHRLDALEARLAKDEEAFLKAFKDYGEFLRTLALQNQSSAEVIKRLAEQDNRLAAALVELKTEAEATYFRKDAAN